MAPARVSFRREAHVAHGRARRRRRRHRRRRLARRRPQRLLADRLQGPPAPRGPPAAPTARASAATARAATTSSCPCPRARSVKDQDGVVLADLVHPGDRWLAAEGGRGGRGNARFLSNRRRAPAFAEQGEVGEEHWLRLELKLHGRRRPRRLPQRRQVHADLRHLGGQAEDRRLPVHHPRAEPRRGAARRRHRSSSSPTSRASSRGRARGAASATSSSATSSGPASSCCCSTWRRWPSTRPPSRSGSCSASSAATSPSCSTGPGSWSGSRADLADPDARLRRACGSPPSPARACARCSGAMADGGAARRGPSCPSPTRSSCTGPVAEGYRVERDDDRRLGRARPPGRAGGGPVRPHQHRGARRGPPPPARPSASTRRWPGPAPSTARPCTSAGSAFDYEDDLG